MKELIWDTIVIGGGPAGMLAAISAASEGKPVLILEQNEKLGKKMFITGKGRCNLTNACDQNEFFKNLVTNPRFLYSAYSHFNQGDLCRLVENAGCPLKTERGDRVFPVSDKSSDVIQALEKLLAEKKVTVRLHHQVSQVVLDEDKRVKGVEANDCFFACKKVVIATGGNTYRSTGSDGSGYTLAKNLGHKITPLRPSLIGLKTVEQWPQTLQGLTLKNVAVALLEGRKQISKIQGEMLFTHFGVSGPIILTHSAKIKKNPDRYHLRIDLKSALTAEQLDRRLQRDFLKNSNKIIKNSLDDLLPKSMISLMVDLAGLDGEKKVNQLTKGERLQFGKLLKCLPLTIADYDNPNTGIVTAGGVHLREIDPATMASRLVKGLYFAGEILDIDGLTGGFNIQIAASTGWLAGKGLVSAK